MVLERGIQRAAGEAGETGVSGNGYEPRACLCTLDTCSLCVVLCAGCACVCVCVSVLWFVRRKYLCYVCAGVG